MPDLYQVTDVRLIDGCPKLLDVEATVDYILYRSITASMITNCRTLLR